MSLDLFIKSGSGDGPSKVLIHAEQTEIGNTIKPVKITITERATTRACCIAVFSSWGLLKCVDLKPTPTSECSRWKHAIQSKIGKRGHSGKTGNSGKINHALRVGIRKISDQINFAANLIKMTCK